MFGRLYRDERGISQYIGAVTVLFFTLMFTIGIWGVMQAAQTRVAVREAAYEAAVAGIVASGNYDAVARQTAMDVGKGLIPYWDSSRVTVTTRLTGSPPDQYLTVAVSYRFPMPVVRQLLSFRHEVTLKVGEKT